VSTREETFAVYIAGEQIEGTEIGVTYVYITTPLGRVRMTGEEAGELGQKLTAAAECDRNLDDEGEAPDFFRPGRTYTVNAPFLAPEIRANFQCIAVAVHPTAGSRRALGFEQEGAGSPWRSSSLRDEEWADGWVELTEDGAK
jgi:hypothetical protein